MGLSCCAGQLEDFTKVTVHAEAAGMGLQYDLQRVADAADSHSHNSSHSSKRMKLDGLGQLNQEEDGDSDAESLMND